MNKLQKKIRKVAYKMYTQNYKVRAIKVYIRETFGVVLRESIFTAWFGPKPNHNEYSPIVQRKILCLYCNVSNTEKVVQYLNSRYGLQFSQNTLRSYIHRKGMQKQTLYKMNSNAYIPSNEQNKILNLYKSGMSANQIFHVYQEKYGYKTHKSILDILNKFGINVWDEYVKRQNDAKPYKDYSIKTIDQDHKGYFYGLMLTDGGVNDKELAIDLTDEDALAYCAEHIHCNYYPVKKKEEHHRQKYRIALKSDMLLQELYSKGVVHRKSKILSPPPLKSEEEPFIPSIMKGVIDGDGWVRKDGKEFFICSASKSFLEWCKTYLEKLGMDGIKVKPLPGDYEFYHIRTAIKANINILRDVIYNKDYGMQRKFLRAHSDRRLET